MKEGDAEHKVSYRMPHLRGSGPEKLEFRGGGKF